MQELIRNLLYSRRVQTDERDHGRRLKLLRESAGLSQRQLAEQAGVIHSNINYWEHSGKLPKAELLIPISKALGVTVEILLGEAKTTKGKSPGGKLGEVFEAASQLPRRQQQKIAEVVEGMLMLHDSKAS